MILKIMRTIRDFETFNKTVKDKKCIIVGPADYLSTSNNGGFIDKYDVIIRLNNSYPLCDFSNLGSRTDILFHTGGIFTDVKTLNNDGIRWYVSKRKAEAPNVTKLIKEIEQDGTGQIKVLPIELKFLENLRIQLNKTEPNMSTIAIDYLLKTDLKVLYVCGCDFYGTGYNKAYTITPGWVWDDSQNKLVREKSMTFTMPENGHFKDIQLSYLKKLQQKDNRLYFDDVLAKLIKEAK
jgi:hypothetical protein